MPEDVSDHRRRRRRRHRRHHESDTKKKWMFIGSIFIGLLLLAGLGWFAWQKVAEVKNRSQQAMAKQFVGFGRKTVIIMNPSENDWGYTTVTINDEFVAHAPEIPKGMQFEIFRDKFQSTNGFFNMTNNIESVKVEPQGQNPIYWVPKAD